MGKTKPIYDTHFASTLSQAMDDFHEALTKRWREKYIEAIKDDSYDYPTVIERPTAPSAQQLWDAHTKAARSHLVFGSCKYVEWVESGQEGSLSAVTCDGDTGVEEPTKVPGTPADGGGMVTVPPHIKCGIGNNLKLIDQWAYGERDNVYYKLPLFDAHDLHKLETAHDDFMKIGGKLGLEADTDNSDPDVHLSSLKSRDLYNNVENMRPGDSDDEDFWVGWTGLAAQNAKHNFFNYTGTVMSNQSMVTAGLANLYAARSAIIQKARNDTLYWCQWATKACDQKATVTTDLRDGWTALEGVGDGLVALGAWTGVGAAGGATCVLVSFLGSTFFPEINHEEYKHSVKEIVNTLNDKIDDLNKSIQDHENSYQITAMKLQDSVDQANKRSVELPDITENNPHGDHASRPGDAGSYDADLDEIMALGKRSHDAGADYNKLLPMLDGTSDAETSLAGEDGDPTGGDKCVLHVRDQFKGFLRVTTARYVVAGAEVQNSARAYANADADVQDKFHRLMHDGTTSYDPGDVDIHGGGDPKDIASGDA